MAMRLAEGGHDLRHLQRERAVIVAERRAMSVRIAFVPFGRMRPDLYPLARKRRAVARAAHCAGHPELQVVLGRLVDLLSIDDAGVRFIRHRRACGHHMCIMRLFCFLPKGLSARTCIPHIASARDGLRELSDRAQHMETRGFPMSGTT